MAEIKEPVVRDTCSVRNFDYPQIDAMTALELEKVNDAVADVKMSGGFGKVERVFEFGNLLFVNTHKAEKITQQRTA